MRRTWGVVLFVLFVLAPGLSSAQKLDEPAIQNMISEMDDAISRRDANGVAKYLSEKLTVTMTITASGQTQKLMMNKVTYVNSLKKGWAMATEYKYVRKNLQVRLSGETKAVVTADVSEVFTIQGHVVRGSSTETAAIELVGGKPLIVSFSANAKM